MGKLSNGEVIERLKQTEFWVYPNIVHENFSMVALEAQMSGCVCVTSERGFGEVIGNRGVIVDTRVHGDFDENYKNKFLEELFSIMGDENKKIIYQERGKKWASQQTWDNIIKKWLKLFKYEEQR